MSFFWSIVEYYLDVAQVLRWTVRSSVWGRWRDHTVAVGLLLASVYT